MMDIRELCYELYKIDWMNHISHNRQMDALKNYYEELHISYDEDYTFDDYLFDNGYDGELYVCFDEFLQNEYLDEDYMKELLYNTELINQYEDDIVNNFGED